MLVLGRLAAAVASDRFDLLEMWSTLLGVRGAVGWVASLAVHLGVSVAIGVVYALAFRLAGAVEDGWAWGLIGGVIHWLVAGSFLTGVPARRDGALPAPGPFGMHIGPAAGLAFLAAHLAFGAIVGSLYVALT
jgi:hypothetical protein